MNDAMGAVPAATRSRLELARTLVGLGRMQEARRVAAEGRAVARGRGLGGVLSSLDRLLEGSA